MRDLADADASMMSSSSSSEENKAVTETGPATATVGLALSRPARKRTRVRRGSGFVERHTASKRSSTAPDGGACLLCGKFGSDLGGDDDLLEADGVRAHHFCLLFASGLGQSGHDEDDGLRGFLPSEIRAEVKRGARLKCVFCKRKGATVGCSRQQCKKSYHLPCGETNKSLQQYYGKFASFCFAHRPAQKPMPPAKTAGARKECAICLQAVGEDVPAHSKMYPACCVGGWMHRECVQKTALSSGEFHFRCPLCNDERRFGKEMQMYGIYVPERDAAWEIDGSAGAGIDGERRVPCDAKVCFCNQSEKPRWYNKVDGIWEVLRCVGCGSRGIHARCGGLDVYIDPEWSCYTCRRVVKVGSDEERQRKWKRPLAFSWGNARGFKKPGDKVRSHASQKAELIRAISVSGSGSTSGFTVNPSRKREADVDFSAADILYRGATAITTPAADDPMNCTLEDLIVKNLDRDSATSTTSTVVRGIRPLGAPKQSSPSASSGAVPSSASRASNSPDTNEASPGDSDYESESNGIPLLKVRTPAKVPSASTTSSVDFNQTIKKSIKDLFMK